MASRSSNTLPSDPVSTFDSEDTKRSLRNALAEFRSKLVESQRTVFAGKRYNNVKLAIVEIQRQRERNKSMMNFTRLKSYLDRISEFDSLCQNSNLDPDLSAQMSSFIWGPTEFIIQRSHEDPGILDVVLGAYQKFGTQIPKLHDHQPFKEETEMTRCVAMMYQDLLQFHQTAVKFMTSRSTYHCFHREESVTQTNLLMHSLEEGLPVQMARLRDHWVRGDLEQL